MRVVIDCNIFVSCISVKSKYHPILLALSSGKFELAISTEIFLEYQEKITEKYSATTAYNFIAALENSKFVIPFYPYYNWNLIEQDSDDYKYADIYIAANADYLITEDRHFKILQQLKFPLIKVIGIDSFLSLLEK